MKNGKQLILGIESSCDETAISVVADGREVLSNVISSQIDIHKLYGGVVPEIASRHHLENMNFVLAEALTEAGRALAVESASGANPDDTATAAAPRDVAVDAADVPPLSLDDIDLIGVTNGPGLVGALLMGTATAKALALATGKPLVGVHHIKGHISAAYLEHPDLKPPFLALVASGGHTSIIQVKGYNEFHVLGSSRDDALGEAYDKVARVLGLGYPGGPLIDQIAKEGDPTAVAFKRVMLEEGSYDFSFSGTKTGVINYLHQLEQKGESANVADVAASFQDAVLEVVVQKTTAAATSLNADKLVVAGGVAANSRLRTLLSEALADTGIELIIPSPILCTDNGAMIACAAYYQYQEQGADGLSLDAFANRELSGEKVRSPGRRPKTHRKPGEPARL